MGAGKDAITDGDVADVEEEANEEAAEEEDNDEMPAKDDWQWAGAHVGLDELDNGGECLQYEAWGMAS